MRKPQLLLVTVLLILLFNRPALASEWISMGYTMQATYQVDASQLKFSGEGNDKQLEMVMKIVPKDKSLITDVSYYVVKQNLNYILQKRETFSPQGKLMNSFPNSDLTNWTQAAPNSPVGYLATLLFSDYRKTPDTFNQMAKDDLTAGTINFDQQELTQALHDNKIKHGVNKDGTKWFYVGDSCTHLAYQMGAVFWFVNGTDKAYPRFNFSFTGGGSGEHRMYSTVTFKIDNQEWILSQQMPFGDTARNYSMFDSSFFNFSLYIPDPVLKALLTTKNGVTVKWKENYNGWRDYEYTIPPDIVYRIQLMYAGCN